MEYPLIDHLRVLLNKHHALLAKAMQAGDGLACFQSLAGRVALRRRAGVVKGAAAIDKQLDPRLTIGATEAGMVGRPLVAEVLILRQMEVVAEVAIIVEHGAQDATSDVGLQGAVKLVGQVGGGEVNAAILGIGTGRDGGGVGGPHAGGRIACSQYGRSLLGGLLQHPGIVAGEAEAAQGGEIGTLLWRQYPLGHAKLGQRLHLAQPLFGGLFRIGSLLGIALGGNVAVGEASIVMSRADQTVEIDLEVLH